MKPSAKSTRMSKLASIGSISMVAWIMALFLSASTRIVPCRLLYGLRSYPVKVNALNCAENVLYKLSTGGSAVSSDTESFTIAAINTRNMLFDIDYIIIKYEN
jgi:hypothetical protein